jgi:hypothetical protein
LFQSITGQSQSPAVTVLSTLAIAALFTPLRRYIQNAIDRRFYRRKYNAELALAAFAAVARDETDMEALRKQLLSVVNETMQPAEVDLWQITPGVVGVKPDPMLSSMHRSRETVDPPSRS